MAPKKTARPLRVLAWPATRKRLENPYSYLVQLHTAPNQVETSELSFRSLLKFQWDVIHVHWPDMALLRKGLLFQFVAGSVILLLLRLQQTIGGAKIVWTVHNVFPHEVLYPRWVRVYMNAFVSLVDGILSPSRVGLAAATVAYPRLKSVRAAITPHGHYRDEFLSTKSRDDARFDLGWSSEETIVLSFGLIRPYKNLPALATLISNSQRANLRLVIAGPCKDLTEQHELEAIASRDPRIRLHFGYISPEEVPLYFAACDLAVLPFKSILNSGSAVLALSLDRMILAPHIGAIPELQEMIGNEWVKTYHGELTLPILENTLNCIPIHGRPNLDDLAWPKIGKDTAEFFHSIAGHKNP